MHYILDNELQHWIWHSIHFYHNRDLRLWHRQTHRTSSIILTHAHRPHLIFQSRSPMDRLKDATNYSVSLYILYFALIRCIIISWTYELGLRVGHSCHTRADIVTSRISLSHSIHVQCQAVCVCVLSSLSTHMSLTGQNIIQNTPSLFPGKLPFILPGDFFFFFYFNIQIKCLIAAIPLQLITCITSVFSFLNYF